MIEIELPVWTLEDGLQLVRELQPITRNFHYHLTIGGGVINNGSSYKDLDLYFLPLDGGYNPQPNRLVFWLEQMWGKSELISEGYETQESHYQYKLAFSVDGKRIDCFIN
jgi:hypothetical protein